MTAWGQARYAGRKARNNHAASNRQAAELSKKEIIRHYHYHYEQYIFDDGRRICFYCNAVPKSTIRTAYIEIVGAIYYCKHCAQRHKALKKLLQHASA
jgi:hypothetical protein